MKKFTILSISLLFFSLGFLKAQTNKGNFLVSSNSDLMGLRYTVEKAKFNGRSSGYPIKWYHFNISPKFGYFVFNNLAVGLDVNTAFSYQQSDEGFGSGVITESAFSTGPFIRYYIHSSKVMPIIEFNSSFGIMSPYHYTTFEYVSKFNIISFGGGIGLAVPLGKKSMLEILSAYSNQHLTDRENPEPIIFGVKGTLSLKIGFTIMLGSN